MASSKGKTKIPIRVYCLHHQAMLKPYYREGSLQKMNSISHSSINKFTEFSLTLKLVRLLPT